MKSSLFRGKSSHTKIYTVITVSLILVLMLVNLGLTYLGGRYLIFSDLTPEGLYTMTDTMEDVCEQILEGKDENGSYKLSKPVEVIFCADPDTLISSKDTRPTYFMALEMQNKFDNFKVKCVNVAKNPERVAMYRTTSLSSIKSTDIIFTYGGRYRVASAESFWTANYFSYDGEYKTASLLMSLTAISRPAAYFTTGHGEAYYNPNDKQSQMSASVGEFADLLYECGFEIKLLEISNCDKIPEDCALLIINNPTLDFVGDPNGYDEYAYVSDLEKIDRYLVQGNGALIINKSYTEKLENLEMFAKEWGISFGNAQVRDPDSSLKSERDEAEGEGSVIIATYDTNEENLGMAYYEQFAKLTSSPKMVFTNTGYVECAFIDGTSAYEPGTAYAYRTYAHFIGTTDGATAYTYTESGSPRPVSEGEKSLAAMSVRKTTDSSTGNVKYSYIFCTNSEDFYSNELLGNASYANRTVLSSVVRNISRAESYATSDLGGTDMNSTSFGGKQMLTTELSEKMVSYYAGDGTLIGTKHGISSGAIIAFTVIVMAVPTVFAVLGIVVFIKRKFL